MEDNNTDFNTKLKKIYQDLVASFFKNDNSPKNNKIKDENNESDLSNIDQNFSYSEIVIHKSKNFPPVTSEKNKNSIANSYKRLLFTEQTTKSSVTNNYFPKKQQNKKSNLKTKTNNKFKINKNKFNFDLNKTYSSSSTYSNYRAKQESEREKKLYEEKIRLIHNRIEVLKQQQSYLSKKAQKEKENEKYKDNIKREKENIKQALLSVEIDKRNEMVTKRKNITQKKLKEKKEMIISKEKIINDKSKEYKKAYMKKKEIENTINEDNNKFTKVNKILIGKIKSEREKNKKKLMNKKQNYIDKINNSYRQTYQTNLNETRKLKNELIRLEKIEEKYIDNMKLTKNNFRKNKFERDSDVNRKYEKIKSFDCLDKKGNIKIKINTRKANSVMKKYKINNQNNISRNKGDKINNLSRKKKE